MTQDDVKAYDDTLLSKERGIKSAIIVVNLLIALTVLLFIAFPFWMVMKNPSDMRLFTILVKDACRSIGWLIVLFLLVRLNKSYLRHIESIKLYRNNNVPNKELKSDALRRAP